MDDNSILKEQIKDTLSVSYNDITDFSINHNFNLWLQNKDYIKGILSQSEDWDESRLCIHKKISYTIYENNYTALCDLLKRYLVYMGFRNAFDAAKSVIRGEKQRDEIMVVMCMIFVLDNKSIVKDGMFTAPSYDGDIEDFSEVDNASHPIFSAWLANFFHIKDEIKLTRLARKILDMIIKDGYNISNREIEDVMDSLVCKTYTTALIISVHPCDYLTQSHGKNWTSCHSLRRQECYHAGIMNMMCDSTSIIIYTLKLDEYYACLEQKTQFYTQNKVKRMSAFINKGVLVLNPLYPDRQNGVHYGELKFAIVDNVLSILGCQDWSLIEKSDVHFNDSDYQGYDDYNCCSDVIVYTNGSQYNIKIGEEALLVDAEDENDTIESSDTLEGKGKVYCECCGERCSDDEMYYVNNYGYICQHCLDYDGAFYVCHGDWECYNVDYDEKIVIDGVDYRLGYAEYHLSYFEDAATGEYFTFDGDFYDVYSNDGDHYYFKDSRDYNDFIEDEVLRNTEVFSEYIHDFNLLEEEDE